MLFKWEGRSDWYAWTRIIKLLWCILSGACFQEKLHNAIDYTPWNVRLTSNLICEFFAFVHSRGVQKFMWDRIMGLVFAPTGRSFNPGYFLGVIPNFILRVARCLTHETLIYNMIVTVLSEPWILFKNVPLFHS